VSSTTAARDRILFVDDEAPLLRSMKRQFCERFDVRTAPGGAQGLELLAETDFAVVVSDMRMPEMNGAEFLTRVRERHPDTTRLLLTGYADMDAAMAAVNEGNIFRFLSKPCQTDVLQRHLDDAIRQYRLVVAERELLEMTLKSSVEAMLETLSLAGPMAFGRCMRVRRLVGNLVGEVNAPNGWQIEVAAALAHLGDVTLPPHVSAKLDRGTALSDEEAAHSLQALKLSSEIVRGIPRLEQVAEIIEAVAEVESGAAPDGGTVHLRLPIGARMIHVARQYDQHEAAGLAPTRAVEVMAAEGERFDPALVTALAHVFETSISRLEVLDIEAERLRVGMILVEDVRTSDEVLLVSRGHDVTATMLARIRNYAEREGLPGPLRVAMPIMRPKQRSGSTP